MRSPDNKTKVAFSPKTNPVHYFWKFARQPIDSIKNCFRLFIAAAVCLLPANHGTQLFAGDNFPNIVVILVDDLGYGELGCQGNSEIPTPNIDSISTCGVRFTQGYVTASYCSPSRAGLLTGRHQARFGYTKNPVGAMNDDPEIGLPISERTIADYLRDTGYVTGIFGKWHLGASSKFSPLRRGFDEFYGFLHEGHYYDSPPYKDSVSWIRRSTLPGGGKGIFKSSDGRRYFSTHMKNNEPAYDANNPILRDGQPVQEKQYLTDAITREANRFIKRNTDKPFFLYLSYNAVHSPMQGSNPYFQKFKNIEDPQRRIFAAMLSNLDDCIGRVISNLRKEKELDNTLIFFLSDNGGPTRELTSSNYPLRGEKGSPFEGGLRVPFMMQWTKKIPAGIIYKQPVSSLDIASTIQAATGFESGKSKLDGVDLLPFINGKRSGSPHERLVFKSERHTALRIGDWKIVSQTRKNSPPNFEVFDLSKDISESNNLSKSNPQQLSNLKRELSISLDNLK